MSSIFVQGLLLGYGASVPLGPINILIMNYALSHYQKAFLIGLGAMMADISYVILIASGMMLYLQETIFLKVLTFFGALFLLYLSFLIFKNRNASIKTKIFKDEAPLKVFIKGYSLTLLNPYTIGFWISVSTLFADQTHALLVLLGGVMVAISSWIIFMPLLIFKTKHFFPQKFLYLFSLFSTVVLVSFALKLLYELLRRTA